MARINPSWSKQNRPSFFKILRGAPAFLKIYLKRINFPTESTIALKFDPEVSWKVKMEKGEGGVYFTKGWKKVSKDMKLEIGDFLVFYLVGDAAAFELRAYDQTCCEKMTEWCLSSSSETESGEDDEEEEEEEDYGHGDENGEVDEDDDSYYVAEDEEEEENKDGEEEIECVVTETDEPTWKKSKQN